MYIIMKSIEQIDSEILNLQRSCVTRPAHEQQLTATKKEAAQLRFLRDAKRIVQSGITDTLLKTMTSLIALRLKKIEEQFQASHRLSNVD